MMKLARVLRLLLILGLALCLGEVSPYVMAQCSGSTPCTDNCSSGLHCNSQCTACTQGSKSICVWDAPPEAAASLSLAYAASPNGAWTVGNKYTATLSAPASGDILNSETWGTDIDYGVTFSTASLLLRVDAVTGPGLRHVVVEEFSATIPSFVHSKTAPNATEANVYNLRKDFVSDGTVNINSGALTRLRIFATMTNAYYLSTGPALLQLEITGTLNPSNGTSALTLSGAAYED